MSEKCVICGSDIPEGRQFCPDCEEAARDAELLYGHIKPKPGGSLKDLFKLIDETMILRIQHDHEDSFGNGYRVIATKGCYGKSVFFTKDVFTMSNDEFLYTKIKEDLIDKLNDHIKKEFGVEVKE